MPNKIKVKADHELRMNWAGWFPHPTEDSDVFARLPSARQNEMRVLQELSQKYPHAVNYEIYDPKTGEPIPGQVLFRDIVKKLKIEQQGLPKPPAGFEYVVPDGVPLGLFNVCKAPEPTEEQAHQVLLAVEQHATRERLLESCTGDSRLSHDKPVDGLAAFVWRRARYLSGADLCFPVTAFVDLMDGISRLTRLKVNPAHVKPVLKYLDSRAEEIVDVVGGNRRESDLRWARAVGITR